MSGASYMGDWFAVDEFDLSVFAYHNRYPLLSKYARPQLAIFILRPGTAGNVDRAASMGGFMGGGLQF